MIGRLAVLFATMALAATAVAGCGGGDDADAGTAGDATTAATQLTEAEFVAQANTICLTGKRQILKELKQEGSLTAAAVAAALLPAVQSQIDEIRELGVPADGADRTEALVSSMQDAVDASQGLTGDQIVAEFRDFNKLARQYGVDACTYG